MVIEKTRRHLKNIYITGELWQRKGNARRGIIAKYAANIKRICSRLSAAEKVEAMTMNRLMEFPFRHLSESDKKWLEIFMWPQDYSLVCADGAPFMELMKVDHENAVSDMGDADGESWPEEWELSWDMEDAEPEGEMSWRIHVEYTNGTVQDMVCYDEELLDKPEELYYSLLEYSEPSDLYDTGRDRT